MSSKILIFFQIFLFFSLFSHCGLLSEAKDPLNLEKNHDAKYGEFDGAVVKRAEEARGDGFMEALRGDSGPKFDDNIIFNVALDKISFMPLQSSDQISGVITTEWFQSEKDLNNRIKLVIYVKNDVIEDASLEVRVFKESFDGAKWNSSNQNSELANKIKKSILDTAQDLYIANEMS